MSEFSRETRIGRAVLLPLNLIGVMFTWAVAFVLMAAATVQQDVFLLGWGMFGACAAMAWTVCFGLAQSRRLLMQAFELGREFAEHTSTLRRV